jgi:hypothetical protein
VGFPNDLTTQNFLEPTQKNQHVLTESSICLDYCYLEMVWSPFVTQLLEHDVPISTNIIRYPSASNAEWIQNSDLPNYEHLLKFSGTYTAIFWNHALQFSELVLNGQALLDSKLENVNLFEMVAAVSWTEGCRILTDAFSNGGKLPQRYFSWVVSCGDLDFLQFWLNIRPDLNEDDLAALGSLESALGCAISTYDEEKMDAIIAALVTQRHNLEAIAVEYLDYSPSHDRLLDAKAWEICDILSEQGVNVPPALVPSSKSILILPFAFPPMQSTYVLDSLYEAGFRDICMKDHLDAKGTFVTPLLLFLSYESYVCNWNTTSSILGWFLAKGSGLDEPWPDSLTKGTHLLGNIIGTYIFQEECARRFEHIFPPGFDDWISIHIVSPQAILGEEEAHYPPTQGVFDAELWQGIREALGDKTPDRCSCHCSSSGCVPMSLLCKAVLANSQVLGALPRYWGNKDCKYALRIDPLS